MRKLIDVCLIGLVIVGATAAWITGEKKSRLEATQARLARAAGDFVISDPSQVHVLALETGEPLQFAWRVYYPPNYTQDYSSSTGTSGGSWSRDSRNFIGRIVFRVDKADRLEVYARLQGGSSLSQVGDAAVGKLLREGRLRLDVEQLGSAGPVVFDPKQRVTLLRLIVPEGLPDDVTKRLSFPRSKGDRVLFEFELGPKGVNP